MKEMATKRAGKGDTNGEVSGVQEKKEAEPSGRKNTEYDERRSECIATSSQFYTKQPAFMCVPIFHSLGNQLVSLLTTFID